MKYRESMKLQNNSYITVVATDEHIIELIFDKVDGRANKLTNSAIAQLKEYFNGERRSFNLPLKAEGTEFQMKVWKILSSITFGKYLTYKEIALKVGGANYSRAVGMACNKNPLALFIPCHRVLGSNRALTGFAGGISLKKELLRLENVKTV